MKDVGFGAGPSLKEQLLLFGTLSQFLRSGMSIVIGLDHLREQAGRSLEQRLTRTHEEITQKGCTLCAALKVGFPGISPYSLAVLEQAEATGTLDKALDRLSNEAKSGLERRGRLIRDLAYPVFLLCFSIVAWPLPRLINDGPAAYLEALLPVLIPIVLIIGAAFWGWGRVKASPSLALSLDRFLIQAPLVGRFVRSKLQARFARALETLLGAGLPLGRSLDLAAASTDHPAFRVRMMAAVAQVEAGRTLSEALTPLKDMLSTTFLNLVRNGEVAGSLDSELGRLANLLEEEAKVASETLLQVIGPVINVLVLGGIGFAIIGFYQRHLAGLDALMK